MSLSSNVCTSWIYTKASWNTGIVQYLLYTLMIYFQIFLRSTKLLVHFYYAFEVPSFPVAGRPQIITCKFSSSFKKSIISLKTFGEGWLPALQVTKFWTLMLIKSVRVSDYFWLRTKYCCDVTRSQVSK